MSNLGIRGGNHSKTAQPRLTIKAFGGVQRFTFMHVAHDLSLACKDSSHIESTDTIQGTIGIQGLAFLSRTHSDSLGPYRVRISRIAPCRPHGCQSQLAPGSCSAMTYEFLCHSTPVWRFVDRLSDSKTILFFIQVIKSTAEAKGLLQARSLSKQCRTITRREAMTRMYQVPA